MFFGFFSIIIGTSVFFSGLNPLLSTLFVLFHVFPMKNLNILRKHQKIKLIVYPKQPNPVLCLFFTLNFKTVLPDWISKLLLDLFRIIGFLIRIKVPNFDWLSSKEKTPFSNLIIAWTLETEMSLIRRSVPTPRPIFIVFWVDILMI